MDIVALSSISPTLYSIIIYHKTTSYNVVGGIDIHMHRGYYSSVVKCMVAYIYLAPTVLYKQLKHTVSTRCRHR